MQFAGHTDPPLLKAHSTSVQLKFSSTPPRNKASFSTHLYTISQATPDLQRRLCLQTNWCLLLSEWP
jgi:hypothetical protein